MKKNIYIFTLVALFILLSTRIGYAAPINLVENSEFETPDVQGFGIVPTVPGWNTTQSMFELWDEGFLSSPIIGSDGLPTGQHMELDSGTLPTITQSFIIPDLSNTLATFSFDAWLRSVGISEYSVSGSASGVLVPLTSIQMDAVSWTNNIDTFQVLEGETITVSFVQGTTGGDTGAHIDQVIFSVNAIPEPSPIGLMFLPLLAMFVQRPQFNNS